MSNIFPVHSATLAFKVLEFHPSLRLTIISVTRKISVPSGKMEGKYKRSLSAFFIPPLKIGRSNHTVYVISLYNSPQREIPMKYWISNIYTNFYRRRKSMNSTRRLLISNIMKMAYDMAPRDSVYCIIKAAFRVIRYCIIKAVVCVS